jgi:hypothetical protein
LDVAPEKCHRRHVVRKATRPVGRSYIGAQRYADDAIVITGDWGLVKEDNGRMWHATNFENRRLIGLNGHDAPQA